MIQAAGAPGGGASATPKALVVLVKTKGPTPAATAASSRVRVPVTFVSTNFLARMGGDVRLVEGRGVHDPVGARDAAADERGSAIEPTKVGPR